MDSTGRFLLSLVTAATFLQVRSTVTVIGLYGGTIEVPCNNGAAKPEDLIFTKWKYKMDDGTSGDLLVKQAHKEQAQIQAMDGYKDRVTIAANSSLMIQGGSLVDQRTFTCMVVYGSNLDEHPVDVLVHKKPLPPQIKDKAKELENGKLTSLGVCTAADANPAAAIMWSKNGKLLVADGKTIIITPSVKMDPSTGLSTTTSGLQYTAVKSDVGAKFTCTAKHSLETQVSAPETFIIHYPTEKLSLQVLAKAPIREGDNVTLKCNADGNPPPTSFYFSIKGQKVMVKDSDTFTLTAVTRNRTGDYKCSLVDDDKMEASEKVVVSYLDLSLSPTGKVLKMVRDTLLVKMEQDSSGDAKVSWTKDNRKLDETPRFDNVTYADAGFYVCEVSVAGIKRSQSFQLVVEGTPVIKKMTEHHSEDGRHKVLTCEAEGVPRPSVQWSINGTNEENSYINGKATHKITVVPTGNVTITCIATNKLGNHFMALNVSSLIKDETIPGKGAQDDSSDQALLIVLIVVGLIIAAALVGLFYWLCIMKSRRGTWKTGEKEAGTSEESKKLEECKAKV
uniref:CD166 antigen homolog A n=1 Tax=Oncorhynchus gorbuscha TaxID=8017 RepID=UPI001EAE9249|nr:CD166 antigen homolog A [Oncorhynchus gorbuscha]